MGWLSIFGGAVKLFTALFGFFRDGRLRKEGATQERAEQAAIAVEAQKTMDAETSRQRSSGEVDDRLSKGSF